MSNFPHLLQKHSSRCLWLAVGAPTSAAAVSYAGHFSSIGDPSRH